MQICSEAGQRASVESVCPAAGILIVGMDVQLTNWNCPAAGLFAILLRRSSEAASNSGACVSLHACSESLFHADLDKCLNVRGLSNHVIEFISESAKFAL